LLSKEIGVEKIRLSDIYPQVTTKETGRYHGELYEYIEEPVDAMKVPEHLTGFRTLWNGFHHFREGQAEMIIKDAVVSKEGIAIFEGTRRDIKSVIAMVLIVPIIVLLMTPLVKPFRFSRLIFTYLVPILPLSIGFDGAVSCLRTYSLKEMERLTRSVDPDEIYDWDLGEEKAEGLPAIITFLVGTPRDAS
jgi:hypothetical protein